MGGSRTSVFVLDYVRANPNIDLTVGDISEATGLDSDQVKASMRRLVRQGCNVTVVIQGNAWRYSPAPTVADHAVAKVEAVATAKPAAGDETFTTVGKSRSGEPVIRSDRTGKLYVAQSI